MALQVDSLCPLLQVFDMPTALRFYRDQLGFQVVEHSGGENDRFDWVWLRLGDADLMLNTAYEQDDRPPKPDTARISAHDDTCLYFGCPDVDAAYRFLKQQGVPINPPAVAPYGMRQLYLSDPDGYNLCFQWPAESDLENQRLK
jgi:catechol 2,3-dioxygenase-like lactoylglutathione lyase family enzyme